MTYPPERAIRILEGETPHVARRRRQVGEEGRRAAECVSTRPLVTIVRGDPRPWPIQGSLPENDRSERSWNSANDPDGMISRGTTSRRKSADRRVSDFEIK